MKGRIDISQKEEGYDFCWHICFNCSCRYLGRHSLVQRIRKASEKE